LLPSNASIASIYLERRIIIIEGSISSIPKSSPPPFRSCVCV
jgi:hypothetical protein